MKNLKTATSIFLVLTLFVINACKKDDSSTTSSSTVKTNLTLGSKVYTPIIGEVQFDSSNNSCNVMCLATYGSDSLIFMTIFSTLNPSAGTHTLDTNATDAMLVVLPSTFFGNAQGSVSGKCTLTKSSNSYNVTFSNVDLIDTLNVHSTLSGGYNASF